MNKIKFSLIALFALVTCCHISAQENTEYEWLGASVEYSASECKKVTDPKSACNQGLEPFSKFIKKFKSKKSFRESRVKTDENEPYSLYVYDLLPTINDCLKRPITKESCKWIKDKTDSRGGYHLYISSYWYGVSENAVYYYCDIEDDHEEYGSGWNLWCEFKRINGKWYLTRFAEAG